MMMMMVMTVVMMMVMMVVTVKLLLMAREAVLAECRGCEAVWAIKMGKTGVGSRASDSMAGPQVSWPIA